MNRKLFIFFFIIIVIISPVGYILHHDSVGSDAVVHLETMKIPVPFNPDVQTMTVVFNDFTYRDLTLAPTATIVVGGTPLHFDAFQSFSLPPTHNFSNIARLSTWQHAHGMVIMIPPNLINALLNSNDVKLSVQYSNGSHRDVSLNDQISLSKNKLSIK